MSLKIHSISLSLLPSFSETNCLPTIEIVGLEGALGPMRIGKHGNPKWYTISMMPTIIGDACSISDDANSSHWKGFVSGLSKISNCNRSIYLLERHDCQFLRQCIESSSANDKKTLFGHVPVELSRLMKNFMIKYNEAQFCVLWNQTFEWPK